ncbi:MAG TPA: phage portal protein [Phycisphaerae bacterium]|nr:phage portal protein [Phycisphaerae bacterium]
MTAISQTIRHPIDGELGPIVSPLTWRGSGADLMPAPVGAAKDVTLSQYAQLWNAGMEHAIGSRLEGPRSPATRSLWVNACITALAETAGQIPFRISAGRADGTRGLWGHARVRAGRPAARKRFAGGPAVKAREGEIVESGDLWALLESPGGGLTQRQFRKRMVGQMYACGRVHVVFDDMVGRRPKSMVLIPGSRTVPKYDENSPHRELIGWEIRGPKGERIPLPLDECITLHLFNPDDPDLGLSPITPANLSVVGDWNASLYNAAMFGNNCEPGGILQSDEPFDAEADDQIRTSFMQRHAGPLNARTFATLWGGLKWQSVASTMADMQFEVGKKNWRIEICAAFRVPPSVAGFFGTSGDSTAYVQSEQEWFLQSTIAPLVGEIAEALTVHLARRFAGGQEVWADLEEVPAYQKIRNSNLDAVDKLWAKGVPLAELSELYNLGLEDRPELRVGYLPINLVRADEAGQPSPNPGEAPPPEGDLTAEPFGGELRAEPGAENAEKRTDGLGGGVSAKSRSPSASSAPSAVKSPSAKADSLHAEQLWRLWDRSIRPLADRMARMFRNHFSAQERLVIAALKRRLTAEVAENAEKSTDGSGGGVPAKSRSPSAPSAPGSALSSPPKGSAVNSPSEKPVNPPIDPHVARVLMDVFDEPKDLAAFRARVRAFLVEAKEQGIYQALAQMGLAGDALKTAFRQLTADPQLIVQIQSETIRITSLVNDRTRAVLRAELTEGLQAGESINALADRVQGVAQLRRRQAVSIARNSVGQANSGAQSLARQRWATHEIWIHSRGPGERRPGHVAAEHRYRAEPKPVGQPFIVNGQPLRYPRDPAGPPGEIINCQCIVAGKRLAAGSNLPAGPAIVEQALCTGYADPAAVAEWKKNLTAENAEDAEGKDLASRTGESQPGRVNARPTAGARAKSQPTGPSSQPSASSAPSAVDSPSPDGEQI